MILSAFENRLRTGLV